MTETGSGVVYDGTPLDGVELALRPSDGTATAGPVGSTAGPDDMPVARSSSARPCCSAVTATEPTGASSAPTAGPTGSPPATPGISVPTGRSTVSGRIDDVITTGAEKVWPDLVERALVAHPGVAEVAVWKRSDPEWGERVVAWVVPGDDAPSLDELRAIVAETIAPWAAPKELVIVDDLPRTAAGKVRRRELDDVPTVARVNRPAVSSRRPRRHATSGGSGRQLPLEVHELVGVRHRPHARR